MKNKNSKEFKKLNYLVLQQQLKCTSEVFRYLMILSAAFVSLAHGSNDVSNAISPLDVLLDNSDYWKQLNKNNN